jgi:hypothetical protein
MKGGHGRGWNGRTEGGREGNGGMNVLMDGWREGWGVVWM